MATTKPRPIMETVYEEAAQAYLRSLPPVHFMEALGQSGQREITLESLALVKARRPDVHVFNEMLVQYPRAGKRRFGQVVPDNLVVISKERLRANSSYNVPLEPAKPFWVLEYVSKNSKRKDYEDSFEKYEKDLKVPYYLLFYPDEQEWTLYRHNGKKYVSVKPNARGRCEIAELELEVGLLDGWIRYWHRGELLALPGELQQQVDAAKHRAETERLRADELQRRLEEAERALAQLRLHADPPRRTNGSSPVS